MKIRCFVVFSLSVVVCFPHKCLLTNYKSDRIYQGSGVEQLQPVAAILTGVPILPHHTMSIGNSLDIFAYRVDFPPGSFGGPTRKVPSKIVTGYDFASATVFTLNKF
jgi:hypothetical protein